VSGSACFQRKQHWCFRSIERSARMLTIWRRPAICNQKYDGRMSRDSSVAAPAQQNDFESIVAWPRAFWGGTDLSLHRGSKWESPRHRFLQKEMRNSTPKSFQHTLSSTTIVFFGPGAFAKWSHQSFCGFVGRPCTRLSSSAKQHRVKGPFQSQQQRQKEVFQPHDTNLHPRKGKKNWWPELVPLSGTQKIQR
jgi:hypothetical protein